MVGATVAMFVVAAGMYAYVFTRTPEAGFKALRAGGGTLLQTLPLLVFAFSLVGLANVAAPRDLIGRWLGAQSGHRGIWLGCLAGAVCPGGPYVSFPLVAAIYQAGASVGAVVAFVTAWSLWAVARLPMEIGLLGPRLTLMRLASTLVFPPIAGYIAHYAFGKAGT